MRPRNRSRADRTRAGLAVGCLALLAVSCGRRAEPPAPAPVAAAPLSITATIFPLADLTAELAGDVATVDCLVPAGATPHTFDLRPQQARQIADARLIVRVGSGYDDWLKSALAGSRAEVVTAMETTSLLRATAQDDAGDEHAEHEHHEHGVDDPHVWLDPIRVRDDIAPAIAAALTRAVPARAADFARRLEALQAELTLLDDELRAELRPLTDRRYIASHAGWNYFNQRYELTQVAAIELAPGAAPSARWRREVIDLARAQKVRAVFVESQLNPSAAEAVARDAGLRLGALDPFGGPAIEGRDSYAAMMRYNAAQVKAGLSNG